jgi:transglutaminase-like putative cysteine protease
VRQSDAHAWVEIFFPGVGWITFDPTPAAGRSVIERDGLLAMIAHAHSSFTRLWDDYLVGIDLDDQARGLLVVSSTVTAVLSRLRAAFGSLAAWSPLRLVLGVVASLVLLYSLQAAWAKLRRRGPWRRRDAAVREQVPPFYGKIVGLLARRGLTREPGETPNEFAARAGNRLTPRGADRLQQVTQLYYRVRFDSSTQLRDVSAIARALLGDVRSELRRRRSS